MINPKDRNHDDLLQKAFASVAETPVPDGPPEELVAQVSAALHRAEEVANQPNTINLKERILAMKLTTKITVSAAVLIAVGGLVAWLAPGGETALGFDKVAEAFAKIRTATWKTSSESGMPQGEKSTTSGKSMYVAPSRERFEFSAGGSTQITILDLQKGEVLSLSPKTKTATVFNFENLPADGLNSFEKLRKQISDAQGGQSDKVEQLGQETIDGRQVVGFRIPKADRKTTIWADPDTGLPVRVESISYRKLKGHKLKSRFVMSDFHINVELDESLFSLEVPKGYTVNRVKMDASKPTVEDLAQTLRVVAEHNHGTFPAELLGGEGITGVMIKSVNAKHGKGNSPERLKALAEFGAKTARGSAFVMNLAPDNDCRYAGTDVKLNTPDRPIFWYKPTGADKYRVIYADLSVKDMTPDDVKKLPEAKAK